MKAFKKNQVIIFVVALMLIAAGYLNYDTNKDVEVSSNGIIQEIAEVGDEKLVNSNVYTDENTAENSNNNSSIESSDNANEISNTTDNESVTTSSQKTDEYFTSSKLGRDTMYSQMIESYQKIVDNEGISQEQKTVATNEITKINSTKNAIMIAENLIKTKGFDDVVIFVNDKSVSVILKGESVEQDKIAQVQNIIARELNSDIDDIHISTK